MILKQAISAYLFNLFNYLYQALFYWEKIPHELKQSEVILIIQEPKGIMLII